MPHQIHQIGGIFSIVDGEGGIDPDLVGVFAQQPSADTVERPGPGQCVCHNPASVADSMSRDSLHTPRHFGRSAARKGHQENPAGICTVDDQMCNAMRQGICLPGARARDDEDRYTRGGVLILDAVLDGSSLLRIERLEVGSGHRASQSGI
jgi:hypothetical protein